MRSPTDVRALAFAILVILPLSACDGPAATAPDSTSPVGPHAATNVTVTQGDDFTRVEGEKAGALFAAIRPDDWNGKLVLLMHGYAQPETPIVLFDPLIWWHEPVADALVKRGYGVAVSSYRVNGFAINEGALDTRIARAMFTSQFGDAAATYLYGWSMGGVVGQSLLETSPTQYDGSFAVCSNLGGSVAGLRYHFDGRVLFDHFFPGVLPWTVWRDEKSTFEDVLPAVQSAFLADPAGFVAKGHKLASIDQLDLPLGSGTPQELLLSIFGSLVVFGGGEANLAQKANGVPLDNTETVYTSDLLTEEELADLNAKVARFEADPQAARYLERYYTPDGRTRGTPVMALHTDGDAVVRPGQHLPLYQEILEDAGNGDQFVARVVEGFGHCEFGGDLQPDGFLQVQLEAFEELVTWAEGGAKPAP